MAFRKVLLTLLRSDGVVHVEFDRVRRHFVTLDFFHLQFDVGIDLVVVEHAAGLQELAVLIEAFQRFTQRTATVGISESSSGGRS
jgi:hypothetical protein